MLTRMLPNAQPLWRDMKHGMMLHGGAGYVYSRALLRLVGPQILQRCYGRAPRTALEGGTRPLATPAGGYAPLPWTGVLALPWSDSVLQAPWLACMQACVGMLDMHACTHARTHLRRRSDAHPDPAGHAVRPMLTRAGHVLCANADAKMYGCLYKLAGVSCIAMQDQYYGGFDSGRCLQGFWWFLCRALLCRALLCPLGVCASFGASRVLLGPPVSFRGSVGGSHALLAGWVVPV